MVMLGKGEISTPNFCPPHEKQVGEVTCPSHAATLGKADSSHLGSTVQMALDMRATGELAVRA